MTGREKLLETLKVAYEPRKVSQYDGSVTIFYPTDEDVADMIEAAVIDEYKHRAEVAERALEILDDYECLSNSIRYYMKQAEKELTKGDKQ